MEIVLITGGTGLVGNALGQALLEKGYRIIILTRDANKKSSVANLTYAAWNVEEQTIDENAIAKSNYIIHLAGEGIADKRWTKKRKQEIVDSRVNSSKLLVKNLKGISNKVKAVVSASAIGWYSADPDVPNPKPFTENDPGDKNFLGETCRKWEESIEPVTHLNIRLVKLRTGIVLSKEGGALKEFLKPVKFGVAAILGNGKQIISWVHIDDLIKMYIAAIEDEKMSGAYNAVAPNPVSNKELIVQLARSRRKYFIPLYVPSFLLKLFLGEMSIEILKSATVSSNKITGSGFEFKFPFIKKALE